MAWLKRQQKHIAIAIAIATRHCIHAIVFASLLLSPVCVCSAHPLCTVHTLWIFVIKWVAGTLDLNLFIEAGNEWNALTNRPERSNRFCFVSFRNGPSPDVNLQWLSCYNGKHALMNSHDNSLSSKSIYTLSLIPIKWGLVDASKWDMNLPPVCLCVCVSLCVYISASVCMLVYTFFLHH